ncbi:hypothetical protein MKK69_16140 [Methylobacterium sp. J-026]|uniref:hypothetical protein n=1 Tax=Methylobacterium sp. J-026 TaxID=2836624 RepID=UPI001FBA9823|nr:hypothetical protein [Methylobacterium sp. J-026]MCJ2135562.1 hypothetical protein [Methylobacterium sp. J-026]
MGPDVDGAREPFGTVPPGRPVGELKKLDPAAGSSGLNPPGNPEPDAGEGPESGGYDNRPDTPQPDNAKGGHGAG